MHQMAKNLKWYGKKVTAKLEKGLNENLALAGKVLVEEVKRGAPVRTGRLRRSAAMTQDKKEKSVRVSVNVLYAPIVEKRKPFFAPAVARARERLARIMGKPVK